MSEEEIELIKQFNYDFLSASRFKLDFPINMQIDDDTYNAIMKLLQEYKQLEKENKALKKWKRTVKQKYISITRLKQKQQEITKDSVYQKYDDEWDGTDCILTPEEMYAHDILDDLIEEKVKQRWGNEQINAIYDLNEMPEVE